RSSSWGRAKPGHSSNITPPQGGHTAMTVIDDANGRRRSPGGSVSTSAKLEPAMHGDCTGGHVEVLDALEAGLDEQIAQLILVGMNADRFGEITIAGRIACDQTAKQWQHAERISIVQRREGAVD